MHWPIFAAKIISSKQKRLKKIARLYFFNLLDFFYQQGIFKTLVSYTIWAFVDSFSVLCCKTIISNRILLCDAIMTKENSMEDSAINSSAIHANLTILSHP